MAAVTNSLLRLLIEPAGSEISPAHVSQSAVIAIHAHKMEDRLQASSHSEYRRTTKPHLRTPNSSVLFPLLPRQCSPSTNTTPPTTMANPTSTKWPGPTPWAAAPTNSRKESSSSASSCPSTSGATTASNTSARACGSMLKKRGSAIFIPPRYGAFA